ncbi:MAG: GNAT family N-acetyltransferase [Microcoleaceae cyanobacterium]
MRIEPVNYLTHAAEIQAIRHVIFSIEQGVDPVLEFDGQDERAQHFLAYWQNQPVGTLRIRQVSEHQAKIERLAVRVEFRGRGIGKKLMQVALSSLADGNLQDVAIHAQMQVKAFYAQLGFEPIGAPFEEANIPHIKMIKRLK